MHIGERLFKKERFDKITYGILLFMTFLVPIFFIPADFIPVQYATSLLFAFGVIVSIFVYLFSTLFNGSLVLPSKNIYTLFFIGIVPLVYLITGLSNGLSRMTFFGYTFDINTVGFVVLLFIYMFLVSLIFNSKERIFYAHFAFIISSVVFSLWLLSRVVLGGDFLDFGIFKDITSSAIGSWNNTGIFFGICAILSLFSFQMLKVNKILKVVLSLTLILSLFFIALVNFSVIWIVLSICLFLFILYSVFNNENSGFVPASFISRLKKVPLYPLFVFILSIVFVVWSGTLGTYLSTKLKITSIEIRPSFSVTIDIARATIKENPFFGSSPNTFINQWVSHRPDEIIPSVFWNTDFPNGIGLIPTFAVTTGLLGILSWVLFFGFYLYLGIRSIFSKVSDLFLRYVLTSSFFISLYLCIIMFVYVPSVVILILTFFFIGIFFASVYIAGIIPVVDKRFVTNSLTGFVFSLIVIICLAGGTFLGYGLFKNSQSMLYFQKSSYALNTSKDSKVSEQYIRKAIEAVPNDIYYRALSEIKIYQLNEALSQNPANIKPEEIQKQFNEGLTEAIKAGVSAKNVDTSNYLNWISLGKVYDAVSIPQLKVSGAYEMAQFAYKEALARNPKNPGILILLSRLAVTKGDLNEAKNFAEQAVSLKNNYLEGYFLLSQIQASMGDINNAIRSVTAASVIDPTNPAIFFQLGLLKYNIKDFKGAIGSLEHAIKMVPDYANAKYFLGLSYEAVGEREKAIKQFEDIQITNPNNKDVETILSNLRDGRSVFSDTNNESPEKSKSLPVKEKTE